ncbi:MAG TPA: YraN family protein [Acidimicrobiales bacterium]|nr:YraN family protein [Acidimicrobiales bacterium]
MSHGGIALGKRGERLATAWYEANGFTVVARNWRCDIGEIDLVATRGAQVVIAEVKTRASDRFGVPAAAVGIAKQRKLRQLATTWLATRGEYYDEVRFDVVSIIGNAVEVIPAAF